MKKLFILISILILCVWELNAQNNTATLNLQWIPPNASTTTFGSEHLASDFGRRECCANKWHDGIDVAGLIGSQIHSIEEGRVAHIKGSGSYKIIVVDGPGNLNFGYGHIFQSTSNSLGNFRLVSWNADYVIIVGWGTNNVYAVTDADLNGSEIFTYTEGGVTESFNLIQGNLINEVARGEVIAPIGDSDADGSPHIHLYNFHSATTSMTIDQMRAWRNCKDALTYLRHNDPDFKVSIEEVKNTGTFSQNNQSISYTINPSFRLRADMTGEVRKRNGSNGGYMSGGHTMDLDKMELLIKTEQSDVSNYEVFKGAYFESFMSDGSNHTGDGAERYPAHGNPTNNTSGGDSHQHSNADNGPGVDIADRKRSAPYNAGFGDYRKTGIVGQAYTGSAYSWVTSSYSANTHTTDPWDDYFFNDIPLRIHKNDQLGRNSVLMAQEINDARYRDGKYHLAARASNIFGRRFDSFSDPKELLIDNFLPYIEEVTIRNLPDENIIYQGRWTWDGTSLIFSDSQIGQALLKGNVRIEVVTSEELKSDFKVSVNSQNYSFLEERHDPESRVYTFDVPSPSTSGSYTLTFSGHDLAGNKLQTNPSNIGYRNNMGAWQNANPGNDTNHSFTVGTTECFYNRIELVQETVTSCNEGLSAGCDYVDIDFSVANPSINSPVVITPIVSGKESDWTYSWDFGAGATPATATDAGDQTVLYSTAGTKSVSLTITHKDGGSPITITKPSCLEIASDPQGSELTVDFDKASTEPDYVLAPGEDILLVAAVSGGIEPYTYRWDLGLGASATGTSSSAVNVSWGERGVKTVSLTVRDKNQTVVETKNAFINVSEYVNKIRAEIFCPETIPEGVSTVAFVSNFDDGDEIQGNETYLWDFGDGAVSSEENAAHTYLKSGNYTVTLKICDNSGCSVETCVVEISLPFLDTRVNWAVDGEQALTYPPVGVVPRKNAILGMVNIPMQIVDLTAVNGLNTHVDYRIYNPQGTLVASFNNRRIFVPTEAGRYEIEATVRNDFFGFVSSENGYFQVNCEAPAEKSINYCGANITSLGLSSYCYDPDNLPKLEVEFEAGNCDTDGLWIRKGGGFAEGGYSDLNNINWSSIRLRDFDELPYTFEVEAFLANHSDAGNLINGCFQPASPDFTQSITVYPMPQLELTTQSFDFCKGASGQIGVPPLPNLSYEWILESGPANGINLLSSTSISDPIFTAVEDGKTYLFTINATHNETGCTVTKEVTVTTSGIIPAPYTKTVTAGDAPVILDAPVSGVGSGYEYQWSPATNLDNPNAPNPIYTVPNYSNTQNYTVDVSFRGSCAATANVTVITQNFPPINLEAEVVDNNLVSLSWEDRSIEQHFRIVKEDVETGAIEYFIADANEQWYLDDSCFKSGGTYRYYVEGIGLNGASFGATNSIEVEIPINWFKGWSHDLTDVYTERYRSNVPRVGKIFKAGDQVLLTTSTDQNTANAANNHNFKIFEFDVKTGKELSANEIQTSTVQEHFSTAVKVSDDLFYLTSRKADNFFTTNEAIYRYDRNTGSVTPLSVGGLRGGIGRSTPTYKHELLYNQTNGDVYFFNSTQHYNQGIPEAGSTDLDDDMYAARLDRLSGNNLQTIKERILSNRLDDRDDYFQDALVATASSESDPETWMQAVYVSKGTGGDIAKLWTGVPTLDENSFPFIREFTHSYELFDNMDNLKLLVTGDRTRLLIGNKESNQDFFVTNIYDLEESSTAIFEGSAGSTSRILKVIERSDNEYVIVMASNSGTAPHKSTASTGTDVWLFAIDKNGSKLWEQTLEYDHAERLFDVTFIDQNRLVLGGVNTSQDKSINLTMFSSFPNYAGDKEICADVAAGETFVEYANSIEVAKDCEVTFHDNSTTLLKATDRIHLRSGTRVKAVKSFQARTSEDFSTDCASINQAGRIELSNEIEMVDAEAGSTQHLSSEFLIFPNENNGSFSIFYDLEREESYDVSIISLEGKKVWGDQFSGKNIRLELDLPELRSGTYVVRFRTISGIEEVGRILVTK